MPNICIILSYFKKFLNCLSFFLLIARNIYIRYAYIKVTYTN